MSRSHGERGFVLLDALIALLVLAGSLAACMGGVGVAGRIAARERERVIRTIEERNAQAIASGVVARDG